MTSLPSTVLVTGASSGIGKATTKALIQRNVHVIAVDRDEAGLNALLDEIPRSKVAVKALNIENDDSVEACIDWAETTIGPISGLVHAAGTLVSGSLLDDALTQADLRRVLTTNVEGTWLVGRSVARRMIPRKTGSLVFLTSNAGTTPRMKMGAYCASKAGATMIAKCLALELGQHSIRCNAISPGSTETPMLNSMLPDRNFDGLVRGDSSSYRTGIPLGRVAQPQDIASVVLFLLSDDSRHITGHDLRVDGGATWS